MKNKKCKKIVIIIIIILCLLIAFYFWNKSKNNNISKTDTDEITYNRYYCDLTIKQKLENVVLRQNVVTKKDDYVIYISSVILYQYQDKKAYEDDKSNIKSNETSTYVYNYNDDDLEITIDKRNSLDYTDLINGTMYMDDYKATLDKDNNSYQVNYNMNNSYSSFN